MARLGTLNTNNWEPLLAFRKRLIACEATPEPHTLSVPTTAESGKTTKARSIRQVRCSLISAAKKTADPEPFEPTGMSVRAIAAQVGMTESTVRATCRQAKQPPRRKRRFTNDNLQRAQQLHVQGGHLH